MNLTKETSHFSEILENSESNPVIIFKHSNNCGASSDTSEMINKGLEQEKIKYPVYIVTVQNMPVLSKKIEDYFNIKHETPQVILLNKGRIEYVANHRDIKIENIISLLP